MQKLKKIIIIVILIILIPILIISLVILVNSYIKPNEVPSFFGWKPFIVLSGSMETNISAGDVVVVKEVEDTENLKKGDIIAFKENDIVINHRIDDVLQEDGETKYITKGDNNNTRDSGYVNKDQIEGIYQFKIARLGNLAMFIQTPIGMIVCLSIPILILVILQVKDSKDDKNKQMEMQKQIENLRKQNEELKKK